MRTLLHRLAAGLMQTGDLQRQSLLHFGTSVTVTVLGFLSTMAVTHLTGTPDVPGGYFLFLSYLGIFSLISSGGLGGAAVSLMGDGERREEVFSTYLLLRLLILAGSVSVLMVAAPVMTDLSAAGLVPWLVGAVLVTSLGDIAGTWLYGTGKAGYVQAGGLVNTLIRIPVQVAAVILGFGVAGLAGGVVAGLLAGACLLLPFCRFRMRLTSWKTAGEMLRFACWAFLASGGMILYGNIDTILLGYFASSSEVGLYRIALQLASFALFSALALQTILYPKFSSWRLDERREWIAGSLTRAISYSLLLALPVCIGGVLLGDSLLFYLYGSPYRSASLALSLLLASQVVYVFVYLWTMSLSALGRPRDAAVSALIACGVNISANLYLIPLAGLTGAAVAILVTVLIHAGCAGVLLSREIPLRVDTRALRSIGCATLIMAGLIWGVIQGVPVESAGTLALIVVLGAGVYFLVLFRLERHIDTAIRKMMRDMGVVLPPWL